ncbi:FCD domain-containing protein [Georgenia halophila]|uniref:FCD domain-containing protein n=1 Tax=Georgenia halophila TaxID=620889 RepID=A0ABP8KX76_9MICO
MANDVVPATSATPRRAWRSVLERIESDLIDGTLGPGDRLPGERELAAHLGVGRSSVREALRVLEAMGLVRTASGSGPTSGAMIIATPRGGMSTLLRLQLAARGLPFEDIVATRVLLETSVVGALASAPPDLGQAEELLEAMKQQDLTPPEFLALDAQFHLTLAEASGNTVVAAVMAGLRTAIESYVQQGAAAVEDWTTMAAQLRAEHAGILEAIRRADARSARRRIEDHITGYYARTRPVHD